jgi:Radical SAM superfamily
VQDPSTIAISRLRELWVHTGTACNLSCPFCHEGSKPGDNRLQTVTLAEIAPLLDAALVAGVERYAFTGGEPLILRDIHAILSYALQRRPTLVLTNGTAPFVRRSHQLATLRLLPHALSFRVSIDYPDEAQHDAGRGLKNFRKALEGLRLLQAAGFAVGITRQQRADEDARAIDNRFRNLLRKQRLPEDLPIVALPDLGALGEAIVPARVPPPVRPPETACSRSRMLVKRDHSLRLTPCPLVDDDAGFDAPADLAAAITHAVAPTHPRCNLCRTVGVNYVGADGASGV